MYLVVVLSTTCSDVNSDTFAEMYKLVVLLTVLSVPKCLGEIVLAVNAGGERHTDMHGIVFEADTSNDPESRLDRGRDLKIEGLEAADQILYQTERGPKQGQDCFGYDIPIKENGHYNIIFKFCENDFAESGSRVFNVVLNRKHKLLNDVDIYKHVGKGITYDVYTRFAVKDGVLSFYDEESNVEGGKIRVDLCKGTKNLPMLNALYVKHKM